MRKKGADVVGFGEGEITLVELMDAFMGKRSLDSVDGVAFFSEGEYIRTSPRQLINITDGYLKRIYDDSKDEKIRLTDGVF